jgi:hypothetical protein
MVDDRGFVPRTDAVRILPNTHAEALSYVLSTIACRSASLAKEELAAIGMGDAFAVAFLAGPGKLASGH